ncbi:hypothetical protein M0R45_025780 [Rubus argutus]|uniref:Uncharacterized protein n=1 Tax=Rubus argutus TaxID=59490 RepID=A0AAW1WXE6_RUBAR
MNWELHRSTSVLVLPREGSSRRGPRLGESGGNNRVRNYKRLEPIDRTFKSDRWVFSRAPSFLTRMLSIKSPRVAANVGEHGSWSCCVMWVQREEEKVRREKEREEKKRKERIREEEEEGEGEEREIGKKKLERKRSGEEERDGEDDQRFSDE